MFKSITDAGNLLGKRVIARFDFNVRIEGGVIQDMYRITRSMKTLEYLKAQGAKTILVAHIDEKEGGSLKPVFEYLKKDFEMVFGSFSDAEALVKGLNDGGFLLLENIRQNKGEVENDEGFAKALARLGDLYINEGFSVSHRPHASIVGVPKFLPSYAGFLFEEEVKNLTESFNPPHPFLFILGGAKFETKMPLVSKFLTLADHCFIGGALSNDFFKAKGLEVGKSLLSKEKLDLSAFLNNPKIVIPTDVVVKTETGNVEKSVEQIEKTDTVFDSGSKTVENLSAVIKEAKYVLWNGPLGDYEKGFAKGTEDVARLVAASSARTVIGGGDTLAVISKLGLLENFSFVSTGGGAMLDFLAQGTLPGIIALENSLN